MSYDGDAPSNITTAEAMALWAPSSCRGEKMPANIAKYLEKRSSRVPSIRKNLHKCDLSLMRAENP